MTGTSTDRTAPRILVIGGGYVGMYTALRLLRRLRDGEATVTVVDPRSYMTYQPFLPEAAAGSIQPRHVVVPLRRVLRGAEVISGMVLSLDHPRRVARVQPLEGTPYEIGYDHVVIAPGSIARTLPIPGLADWGTGFKITSTTRITPPTGRQVARNVLYRLTVGFPYRSNTPVVQPRRWPARLARLMRASP